MANTFRFTNLLLSLPVTQVIVDPTILSLRAGRTFDYSYERNRRTTTRGLGCWLVLWNVQGNNDCRKGKLADNRTTEQSVTYGEVGEVDVKGESIVTVIPYGE